MQISLMDRKTKGKLGEDMAEQYLLSKGYEIVERNFRHGHGEIDIIAIEANSVLVFVEVKLRSDDAFGNPEDFVSTGQQASIQKAAEQYIFAINWTADIRFDVIAIDHKDDNLEHLRDAFY